jgi:AraC-like DNA-binding protein
VILLVQNGLLELKDIDLYNSLEDAVTLLYSVFLYFKAIRIVYKYEVLYHKILEFDNLNWIKVFLKLGGLVILLWLAAIILNLFSEAIKAPYSYYPLRLGSSILIYWVGYQAFFQYVILKDRIGLRNKIRKAKFYSRRGDSAPKELSNTTRQEAIFKEIDRYIRENQRFLDTNLGMEKLAEELSMSTSNLSKLVNQYAQQNFSDYINSFRVMEAKKLLESEEYSLYTIVAIGLECGFNSKSTFYSAFNKFTGQTPTQFRK